MKPDLQWLLVAAFLAAVGGGAALLLAGPQIRDSISPMLTKAFLARFALVLGGCGVAQAVLPFFGQALRKLFHVSEIDHERHRWPPRIVGVFENIAYPCLFFGCDGQTSATLVVGWVGLKTLGDWEGWRSPQPKWGKSAVDAHSGRRRLYVFMLMNALQVALGALVFWLMPSG